MVATFTPQTELQSFAHLISKNQILPAAQFKGATEYEGRVHVRRADNADVSFELLDDTWAGAGIAENDIFVAEGGGIAVQGAWFLRSVVAGEQRNVDPVAPSPEILHTLIQAVSSDPICPNFVRGVRDQIVDVRLSEFVALNSNNHRNRGTLGESLQGASDSLRQLTFDGAFTGEVALNLPVTGGTSGAVGTIVGCSPGITFGGVGHWIIVDMGVDYAGAEYTLGEAITSLGFSAVLRSDALGARSISPLTRHTGQIAIVPPFLADLQHFFDFDDALALWADTAGTIPITLGTDIKRVDNKGFDGTAVEDLIGASAPVWAFDPISGRNVAQGFSASDSLQMSTWGSGNSDAAGIFTWQIIRPFPTGLVVTNNAFQWANFGGSPASYGNRARVDLTPPDPYEGIVGTLVVSQGRNTTGLPEWVWQYSGNDAGGTYRTRIAGGVEVSAAEPYVLISTASKSVTLGACLGYTLAAGSYNRMLTPSEIPEFIKYANALVGQAMPF